ncbi:MAG: leucine--tRNA ligase [Polyangiales bacterium]
MKGQDATIEVFTTRPDTLFGATFMVLAPEHPLVAAITTDAQRAEIERYVAASKNKSDLDRQSSKEKTGVFTGGFTSQPVNGAEVPIWIADYVLMGYGTGAIMAVPAHDTRDFEFAKAFDIPIVQVVSTDGASSTLDEAMTEHGVAVNSGKYDGMKTADMKAAITADLEAEGKGKKRVEYKLRDWVFSRQRYWGEPFPIYFPVETEGDPATSDPRKGDAHVIRFDQPIAVEVSELPVRLPETDDFQPGDDPAGVLARLADWRFFQKDGKWFARETNTMPQWAGSCWYYLRFCDPHNGELAWSPEAAKAWLPVDLYVGGAEHAVLHLLYARFWHMVLYDQGLLPVPEPFTKLVHQGIILGDVEYTDPEGNRHPASAVTKTKDGKMVLEADPSVVIEAKAHKMSKARGNVVNPDDIVRDFGADALRCYEMFMGPLEASKPWSTDSIHGVKRFLDRCWRLAKDAKDTAPDDATLRTMHKTIAKVTADIDGLRFNTAISAMMVLSNDLQKAGAPKAGVEVLAQLLHPFAPHLGEEMWSLLGREASIQKVEWPVADPKLLVDDEVEVPVQINGKKRGVLVLSKDADQDTAVAAAKADRAPRRAARRGHASQDGVGSGQDPELHRRLNVAEPRAKGPLRRALRRSMHATRCDAGGSTVDASPKPREHPRSLGTSEPPRYTAGPPSRPR